MLDGGLDFVMKILIVNFPYCDKAEVKVVTNIRLVPLTDSTIGTNPPLAA